MKLSDLTNHAGEWLRGSGPMSDIVISSRIRLARNVAGYPFLSKASVGDRKALDQRLQDTILEAGLSTPNQKPMIGAKAISGIELAATANGKIALLNA